ncbi:MAG: NAD(+) synthase [Spirochaetaceae bacterium]|nr:NAD(+) synthase [Spirochaetaceae bacterium]
MAYGFIKTACVSPRLKVADCCFNAEKIVEAAEAAAGKGAAVIVFPELSITAYTCGDLFFQQALLKSAEEQLALIIKKTSKLGSLIFVGLPVARTEGIYNCAAAICGGQLLALYAKSYLPNYGEFYERRQFTPFQQNMETQFISFAGFENVPFGTDILLQEKSDSSLTLACEICEDLWVPVPPSSRHVLAGATLIANLSAGNEIIGKAEYRRNLVKSQSARSICAYLYANAGMDESTQDMVFAGHNLIVENGSLLGESALFSNEAVYADIDIERLCQERRKTTSFGFSANNNFFDSDYVTVPFNLKAEKVCTDGGFLRYIDAHPFVPNDAEKRSQRCLEVITLQYQGLAKRLRHINCQSAVIGLSGGLDSTLALLITCRAFDSVGVSREKITAITMPCFGTTDRTYNNARALAKECGVTLKELRIADSVRQHFKDIGQDEAVHDVTYENCQARERTQVLMDYANKTNGIVIGTGDLSELALGWCTYNGDHMSMYGVNSSIPKTLVRYLVQWFADENDSAVLRDILDTPVSPELLPPAEGKISQVTEDLVGPYELHDFFLYYLLRFGFSPSKIFFLAQHSELAKTYSSGIILKWLKTFYRRFFSQQFKRSCMPDGAKVGTINLSPRGDWRMPSDAMASLWLEEIEKIQA